MLAAGAGPRLELPPAAYRADRDGGADAEAVEDLVVTWAIWSYSRAPSPMPMPSSPMPTTVLDAEPAGQRDLGQR